MRLIILVAGRGSRLPKKLSKIPKSLIKIKNKSLIERQINIFKNLKITNIALVTGYKSYLFKKFNLKKFHNKNWKSTNMVYSLSKAKSWLKKYECIVSYGDIIFESKNLNKLIISKSNISVLYDTNWKKLWKKRFDNPLIDAESFTYDNNNNLREIGKKTKNYKSINGQFMGILKFTPKGWHRFEDNNKKFFNNSKKIYTTDVLNSLVKNEYYKIKVVKYSGKWSEIDNKTDLQITKKLFK